MTQEQEYIWFRVGDHFKLFVHFLFKGDQDQPRAHDLKTM